MDTVTFYRRVMLEAGRADLDDAGRATAAVFQALRDRLTSDEAAQVAAQLPAELKDLWRAGDVAGRRPLKMDREAFYERIQRELAGATRRHARAVVKAVFAALQDQLSAGEADDVLAQLPQDLKSVWRGA
jgi:uncharacterized protein (DUF2267 family)